MHSCIFRPRFWVFEKFWAFWDFSEIFGLGYVDLMLYAHALHSHCIITYSCILHAYVISFHSYSELWCVMFSLSLSRIDRTMAPKVRKSTLTRNPLQGSEFSFFWFSQPPSTFGSEMRRPERTSWRTSRNVAFIRNARLSCRILSTILFMLSFKLGPRNLYLRDPLGVLSCLYKSFTPIYTVSIPLYLSLLLHLEVHVSYLPRILYVRYYTFLG